MDANHTGIGNIGTGNTSTLATFVKDPATLHSAFPSVPFHPHAKSAKKGSFEMKRRFTAWTIALLTASCVCALPWTPLWDVVLDVGYGPLCLLGVDRWFSASEMLVLSDGTGAALSDSNDPARQKEVERAKWLCGANYCSADWLLWVDDSGSGPKVCIRARAWSPDTARGLVRNVVEKYRAGERPSAVTPRTPPRRAAAD